MSMLERALRVLPFGASTYSRSHVAFGKDAPLYVTHGDGYRIFGTDGRDYLDMVMGLGSVILGHRHPEVDEAVRRQLANGTAMSLAHPLEVEAAERLLAHFPPDHMVQWGVNGSDATTGAIRLARAITGRDLILSAHDAYHGFHNWTLEDTVRGYGIPRTNNIWRQYGLDALDTPLAKRAAAFIVEPDLHPDWLNPIREWCTAHGALMVVDEVMTWQRYPEWTASAHYGVQPDLWCLGKSLANGLPCSAIVGPKDILRRFAPYQSPNGGSSSPEEQSTTFYMNAFFSSTWAGHPLSMAAVIATLDVMERENGPQRIWDTAVTFHHWLGTEVSFWKEATDAAMLITQMGVPPFTRMAWKNQRHAQQWRKLMNKHGVLIYASHNFSLAHDKNAISRLAKAWEVAAKEMDFFDNAEPELETSGIMRR